MADGDGSRITWSNWRAQRDGAASHTGWEFHLYSDADLTDEIRTGLGPYELINTVPAMARMVKSVDAEPALVLRAWDCLPRPEPPFAATTLIEWPVADDLASLVSLILEIRLRSGGPTRRFDDDPRGTPVEWFHSPAALQRARRPGLVLPRVAGSRALSDAMPLLATLPDLDSAVADGLIRAARGYADAVWIAEADPEFATIKLVGALETAALTYAGGSATPTDRLRIAMPALADDLEAAGGTAHLHAMAQALADLVRSSARFLDFCATFAPPAPPKRPPKTYQISWDQLGDQMRLVYEARSKYLHAGESVPEPICAVPEVEPSWDAPAEIVPFSAVSINGRTWEKPKIPMYLSTLEGLTRDILVNWWRSL